MSTPPEKNVVVPEPSEPMHRRIIVGLGIVWILLHLFVPSRYYRAGADVYDERFAWRMFSAVRVQECEVSVREDTASGANPLTIMEVLPAPWAALLERNRPAVVERFLEWRCEREGTREVWLTSECRDATGDPLPATTLRRTCADGVNRRMQGAEGR